MLTERKVLTIKDETNGISGGEKILSVDEILQEYEIKGLSLEDLQEKYVDMVDGYESKVHDLEDNIEEKYDNIISNVSELKETAGELYNEIEERPTNLIENENPSFDIIFIIVLVITFFVGRYVGKKQKNKKEA